MQSEGCGQDRQKYCFQTEVHVGDSPGVWCFLRGRSVSACAGIACWGYIPGDDPHSDMVRENGTQRASAIPCGSIEAELILASDDY